MSQLNFRLQDDIAIVGMAARVPGADDHAELWEALVAGESFVTGLTDDRFAADLTHAADPQGYDQIRPRLHNAGLTEIDQFDAAFFHITPREARVMDPQQRLILEESWHCIEDSGIGLTELQERRTSVFVGTTGNDYALLAFQQGAKSDPYAPLGNFSCMLANRVSHAFGFCAESMSVDTACSSSLVALDLAVKELRAGTSDYSMVGGVCLTNHPWRFVSFSQAHMMSPDGVCRAFDAAADGFVQGEGVGVLLLERLGDALERGHRILGVVRGSAVNHGGAVKNVTAPNPAAQRAVIETALRRAEVPPSAISYIEAHGTGTSLGDPIEVESLTRAFRAIDPQLADQHCAIGSIKTNIGHLSSAAGVVGIIKVLLMMQHGELVRTLNLTTENPLIGFNDTPFFPVRERTAWHPTGDQELLVAGVSGFGFGGVNAHVVLTSRPASAPAAASQNPRLPFLLSAHTEQSLTELVAGWERFATQPQARAADPEGLARTLVLGRQQLEYRRGGLLEPGADLATVLGGLRDAEEPIAGAVHLQLGGVDTADLGSLPTGPVARELAEQIAELKTDEAPAGLGSFVLGLALLRALPMIASLRSGRDQGLVALALGGAISFADLVRAQRDRKSWKRIRVSAPQLPLLGPAGEQWLTPTTVDADYLAELIAACRAEAADEDLPVAEISQLFDHQATYRRLMLDWMRAADEHLGPDTAKQRQDLDLDELVGWFAADPDRSLLLRLMHVASESGIRRKWQLRERAGSTAIAELAALVASGHLSSGTALGLLADPDADLAEAQADLAGLADLVLQTAAMPLLAARQPAPGSLAAVMNKAPAGDVVTGLRVLDDQAGQRAAVAAVADLAPALLDLWLAGLDVAWPQYVELTATPAALPGTRYHRQRYWLDLPELGAQPTAVRSAGPMLGTGVTIERGQHEIVVATTISKDAFFVRDHVVGGVAILPGVAYVELVLEAVLAATGERAQLLRDVVWLRPMRFDQGLTELRVEVRLVPQGAGMQRFTVTSSRAGEPGLEHARGLVGLDAERVAAHAGRRLDLAGTPERAHFGFDRQQVYGEVFAEAIGFDYGPSFQLTEMAYGLGDATLELLDSAEVLAATGRDFIAHPSILDASLRAVNWLGSKADSTSLVMQVPFSMSGLVLVGDLNLARQVVATRSATSGDDSRVRTHDLDICAADGTVLAHVSGFTLRTLQLDDAAQQPQIYPRTLGLIELPPAVAANCDLVIVVAGDAVPPELRELAMALGATRAGSDQAPTVVTNGAELAELPELATAKRIEIIECATDLEPGQDLSLADLAFMVSLAELFQLATARGWSVNHTMLVTDTSANRVLIEALEVFTRSVRFVNWEYSLGVLQLTAPTGSWSPYRPTEFDDIVRAYQGLAELPLLSVGPDGVRAPSFESPLVSDPDAAPCVASGKRYLISGGSGQLALALARHYLDRVDAQFVLVGRRPLAQLEPDRRAAIEALGAAVSYRNCDVTDAAQVVALVAELQAESPISGVFHLAGSVGHHDVSAIEAADLQRTIGPKVIGAANLDRATAALPLDFFVLFSSLSALVGDSDGSGYAVANAGLNAFAEQRRRLVDRGGRKGVTCSVMWPVWRAGALRPTGEQDIVLTQHFGLAELSTEEAFAALDTIVADQVSQCLVLKGDPRRYGRIIGHVAAPGAPAGPIGAPAPAAARARGPLTAWLTGLVAAESGIAADAIGPHVPLAEYGIDSIMIISLLEKMGERFADLPSTLFFQCQTLDEVADYLQANQPQVVASFERADAGAPSSTTWAAVTRPAAEVTERVEVENDDAGVAIIGYSGRYPKSADLDQFWAHLLAGDDCIEVVPRERWDHDQYFSAEPGVPGKVNTKWGGFLPDVAGFDAAFFGISQREAKLMDPQERLFLETVHHAFEHAGYPRSKVQGSQTAVYVGVMNGHYQLLGAEELSVGHVTDARSTYAAIANRVSYVFDLHGPSMAVDTMCSSSLTAIHLACADLRSGRSPMAVAGGVNAILHPAKYVFLSEQHFGSTEGKCRAFGDGGDGYVPAEGVGAVILKPLARAVADGDVVHAVIRASSLNHGGKMHGFTVPNPRAQTDLVADALGQAQIDAAEIGYIEAHGTGTILGDPVEVAGLVGALGERGLDLGGRRVPIGSVKANVGHAEAAAGIASLSKVLLQMKHTTLVPSIHADPLNPRLELDRKPLRIVSTPETWDLAAHPTALISSFGAGGSNAHLVVSAHRDGTAVPDTGEVQPRTQLVVLSAVSSETLTDQVESLAQWLTAQVESRGAIPTQQHAELAQLVAHAIAELTDIDPAQIDPAQTLFDLGFSSTDFIRLCDRLEQSLKRPCRIVGMDTTTASEIVAQLAAAAPVAPAEVDEQEVDLLARIARTTQLCREPFEWRAAFAVGSVSELSAALRAHLTGEPRSGNYSGLSDRYRPVDQIDQATAQAAARSGDWDELATAWVAGSEVDWSVLHPGQRRFADVPGYAFRRVPLWLDRRTSTSIRPTSALAAPDFLPVARVRLRAGNTVQFSHTFSATDPMVTDHIIAGRPIVPGAGQLAAIRDCLRLLDTQLDTLTEIRFLAPIEVHQDFTVTISFAAIDDEATVRVESTDPAGRSVLHSALVLRAAPTPPGDERRAAPAAPGEPVQRLDHDELYRAFESEGIAYGPSFRSLAQVDRGAETATARLRSTDPTTPPGLVLIAALDAALQLPAVFVGPLAGGGHETHVPAAIDRLRVLGATPARAARLRRTAPTSFDVELLDDAGQPVVQITGLQVANLGPAGQDERPPARTDASAMVAPADADLAQRVLDRLIGIVAAALQTPADQINPAWTFTDLGVDSINGFRIVDEVNAYYGTDIKSTVLFDHSTTELLRDHLLATESRVGQAHAVATSDEPSAAPVIELPQPAGRVQSTEPIAIIGMSGQFPGAGNTDEFWELLRDGRSAISEIPAERWDAAALYTTDPDDLTRSVSKWGGFLDGVDRFDPEFFAITGYEARWMDPQQRLMLTEAWRALDDAGYAGHNPYQERTGVFVGCCPGDYQDLILASGVELPPQSFWGTSPAVVSARIAYSLDLGGPCASFDTACSSALTATYFACQALWADQCEMAVVGGVFLLLSPKFHLMAGHSGMLSPAGRCAAFAADADGFVPGEAVGSLVLKPLSRALADQDQVVAVIKGIEMDQDGRTNGLTAPNTAAQSKLIRSAHRRFGVDPASVSYVEAHGTGTPVGDAIEVAALREAFAEHGGDCALGSVKTNIGHTSAAAGAVGLIKVALSLGNRSLPPSLHFGTENPRIGFADTPFQVVEKLRPWRAATPLRAGLSSFGFGGTNVHAILEEGPADDRAALPTPQGGEPFLFGIAARSAELLPATLKALLEYLEHRPDCSPLDLSYTLSRRQPRRAVRLSLQASTIAELASALRAALASPGKVAPDPTPSSPATDPRFAQARMLHLPRAPLAEQSLWFQADRRLPMGFAGTPTQPPPADDLLVALSELRDGSLGLDEISVVLEGISHGR